MSPVFSRSALVTLKDVGRTGLGGLEISSHHDRVNTDPNGRTERVTQRAITGSQLLDLSPAIGAALIALKDIDCACGGGFVWGSDYDSVAADCN